MHPSNPKAYGEEHDDPKPPSGPHIATGFPIQSQFTPSLSQPENLVPWSTGLCGCCSDGRNCCLTCCCPAITFGQIAEILDQGSMTCTASAALYAAIMYTTGHGCMYSCSYRSRMRRLYNLQGGPCGDCLAHWFCESCALCQEYRELKNRGFDMQSGWQGNVGRQTRGVVALTSIAPTVESGMRR